MKCVFFWGTDQDKSCHILMTMNWDALHNSRTLCTSTDSFVKVFYVFDDFFPGPNSSKEYFIQIQRIQIN